MSKKIVPLVIIFICTSFAWFILGSVTSMRTYEQDNKLRVSVDRLWGSVQNQKAPQAHFTEIIEKKVETQYDGTKKVENVKSTVYRNIPIDKSKIKVDLELDHRKKGLLWYSTYRLGFNGHYTISNRTDSTHDYYFLYEFPNENGLYENFSFTVGNQVVDSIRPIAGEIKHRMVLEPGESKTVSIAYQSQGLDQWWYTFGQGISRINDFSLVMTTNFDRIDFPENSISPTNKEKIDGGWQLTWEYSSLISGIQIGMELPQKLNPGPFVSRISYFAPVSLFLFLFLMFIITSVREIDIHPMNYFFLASSFFAFHLLLAYLIDHIEIHLAFIVSAAVSIFLVISYMRLVIGTRFALRETGLSQFVYLVLFAYAFFLEGYTGLSITILCIITLFVVMQATAKIDWAKQFDNIKQSSVEKKDLNQADDSQSHV